MKHKHGNPGFLQFLAFRAVKLRFQAVVGGVKVRRNLKVIEQLYSPVLVCVFLLAVLVSCDQDSLFADIAVEPPPVDPRVEGSPTNIVVFDGKVYMASAGSETIHSYKNGEWGALGPGGKIAGLASTSGALYALVYTGSDRLDTSLVEFNGSGWTTIDKGDALSFSLQSIYGAGDRLFAGGKDSSSWEIFQVSGTGLARVISGAAPLVGAASLGGDYYVATTGGIYRVSSPGAPVSGSVYNVTGIINVNGTITAVTWDGKILAGSGGGFTVISSEDHHYTGAMGIYKGYTAGRWADSLLLLGVQTTGNYDKGYRELTLVEGAIPQDNRNPVIPGGELSSVKPDNKSKYEASLARYSVHHILQVPEEVDSYPSNQQNWEPRIFASTTGSGVYVLQNGLWNAQE